MQGRTSPPPLREELRTARVESSVQLSDGHVGYFELHFRLAMMSGMRKK